MPRATASRTTAETRSLPRSARKVDHHDASEQAEGRGLPYSLGRHRSRLCLGAGSVPVGAPSIWIAFSDSLFKQRAGDQQHNRRAGAGAMLVAEHYQLQVRDERQRVHSPPVQMAREAA
jgi:hypothetical protein